MLQAMPRSPRPPRAARAAGARRASTRLAGWSVVVAFVLIGVALVLTVWTTRAAVQDASTALRSGQAMAIAHAVRADLPVFGEAPTAEDLAEVLAAHADEGLRYVAIFGAGGPGGGGPGKRAGGREGKRAGLLAEAGTSAGGELPLLTHETLRPSGAGRPVLQRDAVQLRSAMLSGGRIRVVVPVGLLAMPPLPGHPPPGHRAHLRRASLWHAVIEVEPVQANALLDSSGLSLGIGALAAASLLAVAIVLVRRQSRRQADERERERQRRLASLGEMSAVLAHELRNPLASLKGNAQLLAQMLPLGEKPRAKAERVVDEAARLEKLTADLLSFVRTGALQRRDGDPAALVGEAVASRAAALAPDGTPELSIDTSAAPARWSMDADRLREVIVNLVDNARAAGAPVTLTVREADNQLRIDVADRGPGVPEQDRERIFEPFVTGKTQGTGLGLAVARRVVEAHGGTLEAHENPGGGALFRIELPEA